MFYFQVFKKHVPFCKKLTITNTYSLLRLATQCVFESAYSTDHSKEEKADEKKAASRNSKCS